MPIVIGGNVVDVNAVAAQQQQPASQPQQNQSVSFQEVRSAAEKQIVRNGNRVVAPAQPRARINPEDNLVVVGGKAKKIGKQSKYLLDMLTIDE